MNIRPKILVSTWIVLVVLYIIGGFIVVSQINTITAENSYDELSNLVRNTADSIEYSIQSTIKAYLRSSTERIYDVVEKIYEEVETGTINEQEAMRQIQSAFADVKIGQTGYVYGISSKGVVQAHPSAALIGQSLAGKYENVDRQIAMKDDYFEYMWKNPDEEVAREKVLYQIYFEPLDMLISTSAYKAEFLSLMDLDLLRDNILAIKIGETGYIGIIDAEGRAIVHPGYPPGMKVNDVRNSQGRAVVQEMIDDREGRFSYLWRNEGEERDREKIAVFTTISSNGWLVMATAYTHELLDKWSILFTVIVIFLIVSAVTFASIIYFLLGPVIRPINNLNMILGEIAEGNGDLTQRVEVKTRDEIGKTGIIFNKFMENLTFIVGSIKNSSGKLGETKTNLTATVSNSKNSVNSITAAIDEINSNSSNQTNMLTEASAGVEEINSNIESLNSLIAEQASAITQSSSSIEELIANIKAVAATMDKFGDGFNQLRANSQIGRQRMSDATAVVDDVSKKSEGLLKANSVITSIAAQTNLLAMNAAIEAAHAGDSGRGFSVVASEIRKLAENASKQSKEIETQLKPIVESIAMVVDSVESTSQVFTDIVSRIETVEMLQKEVQHALTEQSAGSSQILTALEKMNDITASVTSGADEMEKGSAEVLKQIAELNNINTIVGSSIKTIANTVLDINTAFVDVEKAAEDTSSEVENLNSDANKFII